MVAPIRNWSQDVYTKAYRFAAEAHNGQLFPGTDLPYIMHVTLVCMEVIACMEVEKELNGDLAVQCALLHDVIEDTGKYYGDVEKAFGEDVARGVLALTKDQSVEQSHRMHDSLQRIKRQPHEIWIVKIADRITNLAAPPHSWTPGKIARYRDESLEIYQALHGASNFLSKRLEGKIDEYATYLFVRLKGDLTHVFRYPCSET